MTKILVAEGRPKVSQTDKEHYSDIVRKLWIGEQVVAIQDGYREHGDHQELLWKLDPEKTYRVTIEEVDSTREE